MRWRYMLISTVVSIGSALFRGATDAPIDPVWWRDLIVWYGTAATGALIWEACRGR